MATVPYEKERDYSHKPSHLYFEYRSARYCGRSRVRPTVYLLYAPYLLQPFKGDVVQRKMSGAEQRFQLWLSDR